MKYLVLALAFTATAANAQEAQDPDVTYKAVTTIEMGSVDLTAGTIAPELKALNEARRPVFNPMITLREDFKAESKESLSQIQ